MRIKSGFKRVKWEGRTFLLPHEMDGNFPPLLLNETADHILQLLQADISRDGLLSVLLAAYDVGEGTLAADLDHFLEQLRKMRLLKE